MRNAIRSIWFLISILSLLALSSCGGVSGSGGNGASPETSISLITDQISPTPVVNGNSTLFYIYIYNSSTTTINNLSWNIQTSTTQNTSLIVKAKNWVLNLVHNNALKDILQSSDPITIVNENNCSMIPAKTSCRILLSGNSNGNALLQGSTFDGAVVAAQVPSSYSYTTTNSGSSNSLILSPLSTTVTLEKGFASSSFSVINNSNSLIDITDLLGTLPSGISWQMVNCANPLPSGGVCQIRLTYTNSNLNTLSNTDVNIVLNGKVVNDDGSRTPLPAQTSTATITVTTAKVANLQGSYLSLSLDGNTPTSGNSTVGYIKNTGTDTASIGSLSAANSAFSFSDDSCSNKTLNAGAICSYRIIAEVASINQAGNTLITIPYDNGISSIQTSVVLNYGYTAQTAPLNPTINLSATSGLNQSMTTGSITIANTGTVALTDLNIPALPSGSYLSIDDPNHCSSSLFVLAVGASCSYVITYTPQAPSQDSSVIISGITANYINPVTGSKQPVSFSNSTSINLNSIFAGHITIGDVNLTDYLPHSIQIENDGNVAAIISGIVLSSGSIESAPAGSNECGSFPLTLQAGESCTKTVMLNSSVTNASGNSTLAVTYDNNNGTPSATLVGNISWLIGSPIASLTVGFNPSSLSTTAGVATTTVVTLSNTGPSILNNVQLAVPDPSFYLSYISGGSCATLSSGQLNGENLNPGDSCTVILQYNPPVATAQTIALLGTFSANSGGYTSSSYSIGIRALALSAIVISPSSLSPSLNWTNSTTYASDVLISNVGGAATTLTGISTTSPLSVSGCNNGTVLNSGDSCTLTVHGNYPNNQLTSYTDNSSIVVNYSNGTTGLNVSATVAMQPVVTPVLTINGNLPGSLTPGIATTTVLTLTNGTTATNNGDTQLNVNMDSLTGNGFNVINGGGGTVAPALNTSGVGNPCSATSGSIILTSGASCNINMVLTASGTTNGGTTTPQVTITPSFSYSVYNSGSTVPTNSSLTNAASPLNGTITVVNPAAALNFSYSAPSIVVEQNTTPNPATATITVTNVGNTAVGTLTMPAISGISFSGQNSCNGLAVNATCQVTINMPTTSLISGNLFNSIVSFTDLYHTASQASLPAFAYSVANPAAPNINVVVSTNGCSTRAGGNGLLGSTCFLNPSSDSITTGSAGALQVIVTYTNTTSATAQNFTVAPATIPNYTLLQSNCNSVSMAQNANCTLIYRLANPVIISANLNISQATPLDAGYSYTYGSQGQTNGSGGPSIALITSLLVTSSEPGLGLTLTTNQMLISSSQSISAALSSWYLSTNPGSISFSSSVVGVAPNPVSCNITSLSGSGGSCNTTLTSTSITGSTNMTAEVTAPDSTNSSSSPQALSTIFYAYITNCGNGGTGSPCNSFVLQCIISSSSGNLTNCSNSGGIGSAVGIAINNSYSYAPSGSNSIIQCATSSNTGSLNSCITTGSNLNGSTDQIAFNGIYAYVTNFEGSIFKCTISVIDGSLSCANIGNGLATTLINFNNGYAYIAYQTPAVSKCPVNGDGSFGTCVITGSGFNAPRGIAFNNGFAYVVSNFGTVSKCTVNGDGSLSGCAITVSGLGNTPGIGIRAGIAYVVSLENNILQCKISSTTGNLSNCTSTGVGFNAPGGIAFYP